MKYIIVRHGQTDENVDGGLALRTSEVLLNKEGIAQVEKLAELLRGHTITHAYVSPLKRAQHTARIILGHHPTAELIISEHLTEQQLGEAESMPKAVWREIKKASTEAWHLFKAKGGESYGELRDRVVNFFKHLTEKHEKDHTVLLVSHGGPLGVLLLDILGKPLEEEHYKNHQPKNAEYTVIEVIDGEVVVHELNGKEHLL